MDTVTSADGTRIGFDRLGGGGTPVILVGGALCDRASIRPLAEALAANVEVINYDRRGRGDSGDTQPYAVEREIEDLAALIAAAGGKAAVYGHSSGAGLALHAAATGLPITKLVLHEPPFAQDSDAARRGAAELATTVNDLIAEDRRADAVAHFLTTAGMPSEATAAMAKDPRMVRIAHTLGYEFAVMGNANGGTVPTEEVARVTAETLVICGGASPAFFAEASLRIATGLPHGYHTVLGGQTHVVAPEVLAPVLTSFLM
jgi:pimeloyl-ACP methyl ester carboxylesterase